MILFEGNENIPWLGDFRFFATADEALPGENAQFPIKPEKRSYSQNCVVWIKQAGLQSDIQKLLRHAKKLPEKTQQFYKVCYDQIYGSYFHHFCTFINYPSNYLGTESHQKGSTIIGLR